MSTYLLDTNVLIGHLQTGELNHAPKDTHFTISVITEAELFRLPGLGEKELEHIADLLTICKGIPVDSAIARKAAALGRTRKTKMLDLLIAATAIEHRLTLITKNLRDFKFIPGLTLKKSFV